jgi:hypothetical protein
MIYELKLNSLKEMISEINLTLILDLHRVTE